LKTGRLMTLGMVLVALLSQVGIAQGFPVTLVDDRGQEVVIAEEPSRVVVAGVALYSQILIDIGAFDKIVAVAESPNNPVEVEDLQLVGPSFSPNVELITALAPDLVLGVGDWGGERPALEAVDVTVLTTPMISSVSGIFATIRTVAKAVGRYDKAEELIGRIAAEIIAIEAETLMRDQVECAFLYASIPNDPPYAAGGASIEGELIARAGGVNVFGELKGFPQVSLEEIVSRDPNVIFTDPSQVDNIVSNPVLSLVSAVKNNRVYGIEASMVTSTKVAEVLNRMSQALQLE